MTRKFAVVYEAPADFQTATELADRVLVEAIDWIDDESLEHQRTWLGSVEGVPLTWTKIKKLAQAARINVSGFFEGKPGAADALAARRAILYLRTVFPDLTVLLLVRDRDDQKERRDGLEQARRERTSGLPIVVVGLAIVERESWVISGFDPANQAEEERLKTEREHLGFDPRSGSHDLTACKDNQAKRSPKRVLQELSQGDRERERQCWRQTSLTLLRKRGAENGLAAYLQEIRDRVGPQIGHVSEGL